ncbi:MAG: GNAT family N-acetyltransferase [Tuberibacillus sp.]
MKALIAEAKENDMPKLKDFAKKVGVNWPESGENTRFFMLDKGGLAASCGITMAEDCAIIRALIINPEHCGLGEAIFLLNSVCFTAKDLGARAAYLATTVPSYIFQLTGFTKIEPKELPKALFDHVPFCNHEEMGHATIMIKLLSDG